MIAHPEELNDLISQVPLTRVVALPAAVSVDDDDDVYEPVQIFYNCPCCGLPTYISFADKHDENVPENLAAGMVPPDIFSGEVRLCHTCEEAEQEIN